MIEFRDVSKTYYSAKKQGDLLVGIPGCRGVSFQIDDPEIICIVGENGSGKSTLVKILTGELSHDNGKVSSVPSSLIHQSPPIAGGLSLLEYIALGMPELPFLYNPRTLYKRIDKLQKVWGLDLPLKKRVRDLSLPEIQYGELLSGLLMGRNIFVFDEPAALLEESRRELFHTIMKRLGNQGRTVIVITHKLSEAVLLGDRLMFMKKGELMGDWRRGEISLQEVSDLISPENQNLEKLSSDTENTGKELFEWRSGTTWSVGSGSILGISSLSELKLRKLEGELCGRLSVKGPSPSFNGRTLNQWNSRIFRSLNMGYIPSRVSRWGADLQGSLGENLMGSLPDRSFLYYKERMEKLVSNIKKRIFFQGQAGDSASSLSGGHLQRMVIAREAFEGCPLVVVAEPSREIDLKGRDKLFHLLRKRAAEGSAVVVLSSDKTELEPLCSHIIEI